MKLTSDKERAKDIILAIIEAAGGTFDNKTNLFKAFFHAHLAYAKDNPGFLSTWPIVRMPHGPGIEHFDQLLGELMAEGCLETKEVSKGQCTAFRFRYLPHSSRTVNLSASELNAVRHGYKSVAGKTASRVSSESHKRAWEAARDGEEMNIYLDTIDDAEAEQEADRIARLLDGVL